MPDRPAPPLAPQPGRRSPAFLLILALGYAGAVIAYLPLLTLLLPMRIQAVAGEARLEVLTACIVAGAIAASASNIVFGALSDRSVARGGGRRRWLAGGAAATALSYAAIAGADTATTIVLAVVLVQIAVNALLAPLIAIMADEVPDAQKGVAAGLLSLGPPVASGVSALLVGAAMLSETARFALVPLAIVICVAPLLLTRAVMAVSRGARVAAEPAMLRRDLMISWSARLLVQVAGTVVGLYLLYYLESVSTGVPPRVLAAQVGQLLTIAYLVPLPIAVLLGRLSDVARRRKPVLLAAAAIAALGLVGMAVAQDRASAAIAFCAYAVGSSVFLALHAGFAMQLLPDPRHRGRDLGLLNLTNTLPALLGPLLTWALATPRDFDAVMLVLAALTMCGGLAMLLVRGRR